MPDDVTTDHPFSPGASRESFLETLAIAEALRRLTDGLGAREPFLLVTGEAGIGKSALVNEAIARLDARVTAAFLAPPLASGAELLEGILHRLGAEPPAGASRTALVARFEAALADVAGRGRVVLLVVDDAHHLAPDVLEELRLLVDGARQAGRPLEVLLVGWPALEATLEAPSLAALRQRVSVRARLDRMSAGEARRYIRHRASAAGDSGSKRFPRDACAEIAARAEGVPRRINALAAEALRLAHGAGEPAVSPARVAEALGSLSGVLPKPEPEAPRASECEASPAPPPAPERAVTARAPDPKPRAASVAETPAPNQESAAPARVPAVAEDPSAWVARFLGDQGPIRIGSRAATMSSSSWSEEPLDLDESMPEEADATPAARPVAVSPPAASRRGHDLRAITAALLVGIALIAVAWWGIRAIGAARQRAASSGNATTSAALTTPVGEKAANDAPAPGPEATAAPEPRPAKPPDPPRPKGPYSLEAATGLDLYTAMDERARIQDLTGIEGWVAPAGEPGSGEYRVVLGVYRAYGRAEAAARMLTKSRTLRKVAIVTLPPRGLRQ